MNRKQFLTLVVLGLLVGGLGWYMYGKRKESFTSSSFQSGQKVLPNFPLNEITQLRIKDGTGEVNLVKGDQWTVKERWDYPANFSDVSEFLRKMWDLKPIQDVEVGASQYARLQLVSPEQGSGTNSATLVEFKDAKGANLKSALLGKKVSKESPPGPFGGGGEFPVGRYVLVPDAGASKVWLVNETFSNIETKPSGWLNKDFIKVEKIKSVSLADPSGTNNWAVSRESETGEWKLADAKPGENFDAAKASSLNYAFSSPSFNDVAAPDLSADQTGLSKAKVAKLETFEGFLYTVHVGGQTNEEYFVKIEVDGKFPTDRTPGNEEKPEDKEKLDKEFKEKLEKLQTKLKDEEKFEKWTFLMSKWTVDSLLKNRGDFMGEKKEETTPASSAQADPNAPPIDVLPPELRNLPKPPEPPSPDANPAPAPGDAPKTEP